MRRNQFDFSCALAMMVLASFVVAGHAFTVPFENINVNPNKSLRANYAFGPHRMILCYSSTTQLNSTILWPHKGAIGHSQLPALLKYNGNAQGFPADAKGTITLINSTAKVPLAYSCVFGY